MIEIHKLCYAGALLLALVSCVSCSAVDFPPHDDASLPEHKQVQRACGKDYPISPKSPLHMPFWIPHLKEELTLFATRQRPVQDVSIVTLVSLDRLEPLRLQCKYWPGSVVAALYVPILNGALYFPENSTAPSLLGPRQDMEAVLDYVRELHAELQGSGDNAGKCALDIAVFSEQLPVVDEWFAYPVNALRNRALALAITDLVLLLDGDFIPGPMVHNEQLAYDADIFKKMVELVGDKTAVVFNALDTNSTKPLKDQRWEAVRLVEQGNKDMVRQWEKDGVLGQFQYFGHGETNHSKWLMTDHDFYTIQYNSTDGQPSLYEPYVLARRQSLPWYDERYRGYHFNKMSYAFQLYKMGFEFKVHPTAFLVHYGHEVKQEVCLYCNKYNGKLAYLYYTLIPHQLRNNLGYKPMVGDDTVCQGTLVQLPEVTPAKRNLPKRMPGRASEPVDIQPTKHQNLQQQQQQQQHMQTDSRGAQHQQREQFQQEQQGQQQVLPQQRPPQLPHSDEGGVASHRRLGEPAPVHTRSHKRNVVAVADERP